MPEPLRRLPFVPEFIIEEVVPDQAAKITITTLDHPDYELRPGYTLEALAVIPNPTRKIVLSPNVLTEDFNNHVYWGLAENLEEAVRRYVHQVTLNLDHLRERTSMGMSDELLKMYEQLISAIRRRGPMERAAYRSRRSKINPVP